MVRRGGWLDMRCPFFVRRTPQQIKAFIQCRGVRSKWVCVGVMPALCSPDGENWDYGVTV